MINKTFIANRGEITIHVLWACREMGIVSVAVYSKADRKALFAKYADEVYLPGGWVMKGQERWSFFSLTKNFTSRGRSY